MIVTMNNKHMTPSGGRPPVPGDLIAYSYISRYTGLDGTRPLELLTLFNRAARNIFGLSHGAIAVYNYLFRCTNSKDWGKNSLALVWCSNEMIHTELNIRDKKTLSGHFKALRSHGLIGYKDSPTRKRRGKRDAHGRIVLHETFGIIMNPIAVMKDELKRKLRDHDALIRRTRALKKKQRSIKRTAEELDELFSDVLTSNQYLCLQRIVIKTLSRCENSSDLDTKEHLLSRLDLTFAYIAENIINLSAMKQAVSYMIPFFINNKKDPKGGNNTPSIRTITGAPEYISNGLAKDSNEIYPHQNKWKDRTRRQISDNSIKPTIHEELKKSRRLVRLLPQSLRYDIAYEATYEDILTIITPRLISLGLRADDISDCRLSMGKENAAITLTVLLLKEPEIRNLRGYLHGMIKKHRSKELNLSRSLFGIEAEQRKMAAKSDQYKLT